MYPTRFFCPWGFLGKNTGVGCHFLLQGIFLTQGSNRTRVSCIGRQVFFTTEPPGRPYTSLHSCYSWSQWPLWTFFLSIYLRAVDTLPCSVSTLCPRHFAGHWRWSREDLVPYVTIMQCGEGTDKSQGGDPTRERGGQQARSSPVAPCPLLTGSSRRVRDLWPFIRFVFGYLRGIIRASLVALMVKNLPAMQETQVSSQGW